MQWSGVAQHQSAPAPSRPLPRSERAVSSADFQTTGHAFRRPPFFNYWFFFFISHHQDQDTIK
jgi:hypothetical protein